MTLQLTGAWPVSLVLALAALLGAGTIWIYRRHRLPSPWNRVLPALRIVALLCLLFSLLRPIVARVDTRVLRGRIPVVIDDSGSMSVRDQYEDDEAVRIAWNLEWFPPALRVALFETPPPAFGELDEALTQALNAARELPPAAAESGPRRRGLARLRRETAEAGDRLDRLLREAERATANADYLQGASVGEPGGGLRWERYDNIEGAALSDLLSAPAFPNAPSHTGTRNEFSIPANAGDRYGSRVSGYLYPPETGDYVFAMTSDDQGALYFGHAPDDDAKERIIFVEQWRPADNWSAVSRPIPLQAGQRYYLEALHKEATGSDHMAVGWTRPDETIERPIPGRYFHPHPDEPDTFGRLYAQWSAAATLLRDELNTLEERCRQAARASGDAAERKTLTPEAAVVALEDLLARWRALAVQFQDLQSPADKALAQANVPEVEQARERLAETTRWQLALHVLRDNAPGLLRALQRKGDVELFTLDEERIEPLSLEQLEERTPTRASTRLGSLMHKLLQQYEVEPLAALCVITDGRVNAGLPLAAVREMATERNLPLVAFGIGAETPPNDIAIESVTVPETAFKGDQVRATVVLHRHGFEDRELPMTIRRGTRVMHEFTVPPGAASRVTIETSFEEDEDGDHRYVLETPVLDGEALQENNRRSFHARFLEDRIRTLLVDEFPRWESRYVRMMLTRDRRVELDTVFIASHEDGKMPREPGAWPADRETLFGYQTVLLGDVNPDHFSEQELEDLRDFVLERGGSLVVLAGPHHMPARYVATPLADVFPFLWSDSPANALDAAGTPEAEESADDTRLRIARDGRHDSLPRIGGDAETNEQLWRRLPGVNWVAPGVRVAPAADSLAETDDADSRPVMIRGYAGAGRVLFLGADSFWRWRDRSRWRYHHRFWGQIMLWSAIGRTAGSDRHVKMSTDRPRYAPDETVMIQVRLLDEEQRPVENAQAVVDVYDEKETRIREVPLLPAATGAGEYRGELTGLPRGHFTLKPRVFEMRHLEADAELSIDVGDVAAGEYIHLEQDRPRLERWADAWQPVFAPLAALSAIEPVETRDERRREYEQPVHALLLLIAALALGAEWQLRKRCRLA